MKKYISAVLALAVVVSLCLPYSSAAPDDTAEDMSLFQTWAWCVATNNAIVNVPGSLMLTTDPRNFNHPELFHGPAPVPNAPALYIVGASYSDVPLGDAVLIPSLDFVGTTVTDAAGDILLNFSIPSGVFPHDTYLAVQFWQDADLGSGTDWRGAAFVAFGVNVAPLGVWDPPPFP